MKNFSIGVLCFGQNVIYHKTKILCESILKEGYDCYVLTDDVDFFKDTNATIIEYNRVNKSYHDKIILHKKILQKFNVSIVLDADILINNFYFLYDLNSYEFKQGVSYLKTLKDRIPCVNTVADLNLNGVRWDVYNSYVNTKIDNYNELETIWEYVTIFNKNGLNDEFFKVYEQLQLMKECCDLFSDNIKILGAGEGISIKVSAEITKTNCELDDDLNKILEKYFVSHKNMNK